MESPAGADGADVIIEGPRFAQVPETLLYDPNLSDGAVRVYGVLLRHGETPGSCYPSHERIAELTGKQARSINRLVVELERAGWVRRVQRPRQRGHYTSCSYIVRTVATAQQSATAPAHESATAGAQQSAPTTAHESAPNESNGNESQKNERTRDLTGFVEFWEQYPKRHGKRIGRGKCEALWVKLTLPDRRDAWRGAGHYAAACNAGLTLAKDPERWLKNRCWLDWQEPATPEGTRARPADRDPLRRRGERPLGTVLATAAGIR